MATKKCPVCGVPVKLENLERHVKTQHPRENIDIRSHLTEEETTQAKAVKTTKKPNYSVARMWPLAVLAIIIVVALFIALQKPAANSNGNSTGIGIGQTAPEISMTTTDGNLINLVDLRGKPTVLEFMDVDCGYCINEAGVLSQVYNDRHLVANFLSVDVNFVGTSDDAAKINQFRSDHNTWWPYALDADGSVTNTYGVVATPKVFVLDQNGVVRNSFDAGEVPGGKATYEAAIDALL
jgi:peroxiredoxin